MSLVQVDGAARWLAALVPPRCALCHAASDREPFCEGCTRSLPWTTHPCRGCAMPMLCGAPELCADCLKHGAKFDRAWSAFRLLPPVQQLIHQLKYAANLSVAHALGTLAAQRLARRAEPLPDLLIPVPLHRRRLRERGYNQALEIVRAMHRVIDVPIGLHLAERVRPTVDQIGQSAAQRRGNLKGAFAIRGSLAGAHVALVDDVMTTGATLAELATVCRGAGAVRIEAWAIARAL